MYTKEEEKKRRLKELKETTDWTAYNNKRRWGHPHGKAVNLAHISASQKKVNMWASVELQRRLNRFMRLYPQYVTTITTETIASNLITATAYYMRGLLKDAPLSNYLLYLIYQDWKDQKKFRDSPKKKNIMYNQLISLGVVKLCFEEALKKIIEKDIELTTHYEKPNKEYTTINEAYNQATLGFDSYSFDK